MPRKTSPRGAAVLAQSATDLHRRPIIWLALVGSLLVVMALSLSRPPEDDQSVASNVRELTESEAAQQSTLYPTEASIPPAPPELPWRKFIVRDGDNLSLIFNRAGFTDTDLYRVAAANSDRSLKRIYPGEVIRFQANVEGDLVALRHVQSPLLTTLYERDEKGYVATDIVREPERNPRNVSMTIDSSLFLAGIDAGLSDAMIMELAGIFGGVIDFVLDPRIGDTIHMVFEELLLVQRAVERAHRRLL